MFALVHWDRTDRCPDRYRVLCSVGSGVTRGRRPVIEGEVQAEELGERSAWSSLTDGTRSLPARCSPTSAAPAQHAPRQGDLVQVDIERPDLWRGGKLDLIVSQICLAGEGELLRRRQELTDRLGKEGRRDPARLCLLSSVPARCGRHSRQRAQTP